MLERFLESLCRPILEISHDFPLKHTLSGLFIFNNVGDFERLDTRMSRTRHCRPPQGPKHDLFQELLVPHQLENAASELQGPLFDHFIP